eukprot:TRINITY_DN6006_c0_g1_i8.p1 TRINITY_DN6006_c0_g1~~TRINITY_DN6006_c0_g1_i8.p1  ORF type:complete len:178 (-),score=16.88 TRINITY_DN6006_c0_g1_i8:2563-3096(-)
MVGYPSYGLDSQNYFSTKQSKAIKSPAMDSRNSPKSGKPQSRPFNQHNNNRPKLQFHELKPKLQQAIPSQTKVSVRPKTIKPKISPGKTKLVTQAHYQQQEPHYPCQILTKLTSLFTNLTQVFTKLNSFLTKLKLSPVFTKLTPILTIPLNSITFPVIPKQLCFLHMLPTTNTVESS